MEMEEDDKPFECPVCKMRFVSEDRLSVHKERHKFALSLNTSTPKLISEISDQTPTPTRFIKNCEEVGLFADLVNPFEEHFRRASQSGSSALINCNAGQPTESLNTPYIPLNTSDVLPTKLIFETKNIKKQIISPDADSETNPFPIDETPDIEKPETPPTVLLKTPKLTLPLPISSNTSVISTSNSPRIISVTSQNPSQTTVITSVGMSSAKQKLSGVPTAVVVKPRLPTTSTITGTIVKKVVKNPIIAPTTTNVTLATESATLQTNAASQGLVLQLILKLPDGQSMPFNIPAVPANSTGVPQNLVAVAAPSATAQIPTAKMKIKDTLEQQIALKTSLASMQTTPIQTISGSTVRLNTVVPTSVGINIPSSVNHLSNTSANQNNVAAVVPTVRMSNSNMMIVTNSNGKRKRSDDEDPDVKRRKFLERNRAAATRCRRKRKEKFDQLEMKAQELMKNKEQLEGMVSVLRKEVAHLKSLLLAHKDCEITQQQKAAGHPEAFAICNMAMNIQALCSTSTNPAFQTISGLTSNDSGGIEVLTFIEKTEDDMSQTSESSMMEPSIGVDTSNDSSPFQDH